MRGDYVRLVEENKIKKILESFEREMESIFESLNNENITDVVGRTILRIKENIANVIASLNDVEEGKKKAKLVSKLKTELEKYDRILDKKDNKIPNLQKLRNLIAELKSAIAKQEDQAIDKIAELIKLNAEDEKIKKSFS